MSKFFAFRPEQVTSKEEDTYVPRPHPWEQQSGVCGFCHFKRTPENENDLCPGPTFSYDHKRPVGGWRFCPACGRPASGTSLALDGAFSDVDDTLGAAFLDHIICTCCDRVWNACPCTPATEGRCKAIK